MSINRVAISGNIGNDPDLRQTAGGMQVLSFSVAVNDRVKDANGEWTDRPNWIGCVMFGNRAESVSRFLSKGSKVAIEGRLRYSSWETDDGGKRSKVEVIVDEIEFMTSRNDAPQPVQRTAASTPMGRIEPAQQPPLMTVPAVAPSIYDENIPF